MAGRTVNVVSESAFTVGRHGVHSAFLEHTRMLRGADGLTVSVNSWRPAQVHHVHTVGPWARGRLIAARERSVVTAHLTPGSLIGSLAGSRLWIDAATRYLVNCYNLAGIVAALNHHDVAELRQLGVHRPIRVMPNTVDVGAIRRRRPDVASARRALRLPPESFVVVTVGQLQPRKGLATFLDCARSCPDVSFVWVGGTVFGWLSADRTDMRRLAAGAPPNVRFAGLVDRAAVLDHLAAADLLFLPSTHENCPMAVLEAAAVGLPLLVRDLPQYTSQYGSSCLYGRDGEFPDLVKQCASDDALRNDLRQRSRDLARRFDHASTLAAWMDIYETLAG